MMYDICYIIHDNICPNIYYVITHKVIDIGNNKNVTTTGELVELISQHSDYVTFLVGVLSVIQNFNP